MSETKAGSIKAKPYKFKNPQKIEDGDEKTKFGSGKAKPAIRPDPKTATNKNNEDFLQSNCFYVSAAHLLNITPKAFVALTEQMMPSDNFSGEDLPIINRVCEDAHLVYSEHAPTEKMDKYGIGYLREDGSGHCVVVTKGRFLDFQNNEKGTNVRDDVEGSGSHIKFYFWELGVNDVPMDTS